jgi:hypothetical protein
MPAASTSSKQVMFNMPCHILQTLVWFEKLLDLGRNMSTTGNMLHCWCDTAVALLLFVAAACGVAQGLILCH